MFSIKYFLIFYAVTICQGVGEGGLMKCKFKDLACKKEVNEVIF